MGQDRSAKKPYPNQKSKQKLHRGEGPYKIVCVLYVSINSKKDELQRGANNEKNTLSIFAQATKHGITKAWI